jgi:hypothetical protein
MATEVADLSELTRAFLWERGLPFRNGSIVSSRLELTRKLFWPKRKVRARINR